jgi:hypothetical protein
MLIHQYLNENVINEDAALSGHEIYCEWINENIYVRKQLQTLVSPLLPR